MEGRRALVTAASKGLGRASAEALGQEGAKVYISSRNKEVLERTAREIGAAGWRAADVSNGDECEALVQAAAKELGGLDILIVNAGGPPAGTFQSTPLDRWEPAFHLTLMSAVRLVHAALPHLKTSGQGRIVFITSIAVRQPIPNIAMSNSLRAGVTGLAKTLALELARDQVTVNCLAPGSILTDRIRNLAAAAGQDLDAYVRRIEAEAPMGRIGDPAEFGATCAFICSKPAAYITGQTIGIDGGQLVGVY